MKITLDFPGVEMKNWKEEEEFIATLTYVGDHYPELYPIIKSHYLKKELKALEKKKDRDDER